jgi:phospholipase/carboxylesterase
MTYPKELGAPNMYTTNWVEPHRPQRRALIFLHGRGQSAAATLSIAHRFTTDDTLLVLPAASSLSWYPNGFLAPLDANAPHLEASLQYVDDVLDMVLDRGFQTDAIAIGGFSQGAALAAEFVGRRGPRCGSLICLTGGRIGPPGTLWDEEITLAGISMWFSGGLNDPFVPFGRVEQTAAHFAGRGAEVDVTSFDDDEHVVRDAECDAARRLLRSLPSDAGSVKGD